MIDPKSLMIGNYVMLRDKGTYQIDSGHDLDELDSFPIDDDYCKPIPLNEDWLVKFGFQKRQEEEDYFLNVRDDNGLGENICMDPLDGECDIESYNYRTGEGVYCYSFLRVCKYLHELQNLIYILTGEQLEIKPLTPIQ